MLLSELREIFLRLDKAMERVAEGEARGGLTISVAPMFAVKWLVLRLRRFDALHSDLDMRMSSSLRPVDFQREDFDAAIRFGRGRYPGLEAVKLFDESVTPLCSPRLLESTRALRSPDDLRHHVLLHDDSMGFDPAAPNWDAWLQAAGARRANAARGPHFSQPDLALQAAVDGAGVVLGWRYLAADDIAAGRLVQPFKLVLPLRSAFHLVYPEASAGRPKIAALREWLLKETAHDVADGNSRPLRSS